MDLLVTGGTGFLGRHLAAALQRRGHRVRLLAATLPAWAGCSRTGPRPSPWICATVARWSRHALGPTRSITSARYRRRGVNAPTFMPINVGGTEAVIEGCRRHAVGRLIYVSSPSVVFDGRDHCYLTEDAPYPRRFASVYSLTKKLAKDRVNAATDFSR